VWQVWSFGAVDGRATDGYLTFSGDSDAAALGVMVGDGPFYQQIGGSFYLDSSVSRFPCSLTVSFWRTLFPATATTDTELSSNTVTITCVTGQFVILGGMTVLNPGESYTFSPAVPLVGLLAGDPHSASGTFGGVATCNGTLVSIQGRIAWSNSERIHGLHGIVRECYEEGNPCANLCDGGTSPRYLYVTISNYTSEYRDTLTNLAVDDEVNGTYIIERLPGTCDNWYGQVGNKCRIQGTTVVGVGPLRSAGGTSYVSGLGVARMDFLCFFPLQLRVTPEDIPAPICGSSYDYSGTSTDIFDWRGPIVGSFDWRIRS
jgi:hypothetical protein